MEDTSYYFRVRANLGKIGGFEWSSWSKDIIVRTPKSKFIFNIIFILKGNSFSMIMNNTY